jgi:HPt (histidine-containing phosphotransfer) domain-containing protein
MQEKQVESKKPALFVARVEEDLSSLIPTFLENRKKDASEIQSCLNSQNYQKIQRIGHTLKGVAGSYGLDLMGQYGSEMELAAKENDKNAIEISLNKMTNYLLNVEVAYY